MRLLLILILALILVEPALAQTTIPGPGDVAPQPDGPVATGVNLWLIIIGAGIRGVMYVINHRVPWLRTEPQKQISVALAGAIGGLLYDAAASGTLIFDDSMLNSIIQCTVSTLAAHNILFKPGVLNTKLGGGSNHDDPPQG